MREVLLTAVTVTIAGLLLHFGAPPPCSSSRTTVASALQGALG